jgi:hypothetical protein
MLITSQDNAPQPADVALEPRLAYRRSPARAVCALEPFVGPPP